MVKNTLIFAALLLLFTAGTASAEGMYAGFKYRKIQGENLVFFRSNDDLDESAATAGVLLGYSLISKHWVRLAVEAEFSKSIASGDFHNTPNNEWEIDTQTIYGVFTFGTKVYGKIKLGSSRNVLTRRVDGVTKKRDNSGPAAGIGIGYRFTPRLTAEIESTVDYGGKDFIGTSFGLNYHF
ncbi:MAG: outer membrane beta-barrel protein [Gammaproteobacteria bacterium]